MDDLVTNYFLNKYTPEARGLLYRAMGIFTVSNYTEPFGDIVNLLGQEQVLDESAISDGVREICEKGIWSILQSNRINVHGDVTFEERIVLCEALFMLTKVEDPTDYLPLFDGWLSNEEILAKTLGLALDYPHEILMTQIAWVYEGTVQRLKEYMETLKKDLETVDIKLIHEIRLNIVVFYQVFGDIPIIDSLTELNILKGQPFTTYINLLESEIISEDEMEQNVYCLLWLALVSSDGYQNPKTLLVDQGRIIFPEPTHYALFDQMLNKALAAYLPAREVKK